MSTQRIFFTLITSVLIVYAVQFITVDQRVLIDQAARKAVKDISSTLSKQNLKMDENEAIRSISGVSQRTQSRIEKTLLQALTS